MGRTAAGVRGIRLPEGEEVISLIVPDPEGLVLTASENGYGKLTPAEEFPRHGRGGQGVIAMQTTERNGSLVAATQVAATDELMLMSSSGTLVRTRAGEISILGRNTQGVRLIRLDDGERLIGVEPVEPGAVANGEDGEGHAEASATGAAAGEPPSEPTGPA
jgi:DNA gyrase subunit A